MPPSNIIHLAPGESLDVIAAEADMVRALKGLVVLARPMHRGELGEMHMLPRESAHCVERAGHWCLGNVGETPAQITIVRMGAAYARWRHANRRERL
jgi:hypothetical protein